MPKITICRTHSLPPQQARNIIDQVAAKMRARFDIQGSWQDDSYHFSRQGMKGSILLKADEILVQAELSPLFAPLKPMVTQEIQRKLDEYFG
jgi:putative polyhydroxyalkanoate system protein